MTTRALARSGRSLLVVSSPTQRERALALSSVPSAPAVPAARALSKSPASSGSTAAEPPFGGDGLKGRSTDGHEALFVEAAHLGKRVAGIQGAEEGAGVLHGEDFGDGLDIQKGGGARQVGLGEGTDGGYEGVVVVHQAGKEGCCLLGQGVGEVLVLTKAHALEPRQGGGLGGQSRARLRAGKQEEVCHSVLGHRPGGGESGAGRGLEPGPVVVGKEEDGHGFGGGGAALDCARFAQLRDQLGHRGDAHPGRAGRGFGHF